MKLAQIIEKIVADDPTFQYFLIMRKGDDISIKGSSESPLDALMLALDGAMTMVTQLAEEPGRKMDQILDLIDKYLRESAGNFSKGATVQ